MNFKFGFLTLLLMLGFANAQVYKLRVTEWSCSMTSTGRLVAVGLVRNQSGNTLRDVRINLRAIDKAGAARGSNSELIAARLLRNGASTRFSVSLRPTRRDVDCQIWFRNPEVIRIPTLLSRAR